MPLEQRGTFLDLSDFPKHFFMKLFVLYFLFHTFSTMKINPFLITGYQGPEYFCNREKETLQLQEAMESGRNMTLFSPRRMGKTGLIHHFFNKLGKESTITIYTDIFGTEDLNGFINRLATASLQAIETKKESFLGKAFELFSRIRPQIGYDSLTGMPQVSLTFQNDAEKQASLKEIFGLLDQQKKPCFVAIDEFQQISRYPEKNTEEILRTYIQALKNVHFIFSGSQHHLLTPMFSDAKRPFYQSTGYLFLDKLEKEEYQGFISSHFNKNKQKIPDENVNYIQEWSKNYTFYTQFLCNKVFSKGHADISRELINECIREIFAEREAIFYNYRNLLSHHQFMLLAAIAAEGHINEPTAQDFMKKHNLSNASTVRKSLQSLIDKEMIYETPGKDKSRYEVYDVFLGRWFQEEYGR